MTTIDINNINIDFTPVLPNRWSAIPHGSLVTWSHYETTTVTVESEDDFDSLPDWIRNGEDLCACDFDCLDEGPHEFEVSGPNRHDKVGILLHRSKSGNVKTFIQFTDGTEIELDIESEITLQVGDEEDSYSHLILNTNPYDHENWPAGWSILMVPTDLVESHDLY